MKLEIGVEELVTEVSLDAGRITLGGADDDGIQVAGLEPGLLELRVEGERLVVLCQRTFQVDDILSPPAVARLIVAGERIRLSACVWLRLVPSRAAEAVGTAAVLKDLLMGLGDPDEANCPTLTCLTGMDVGRRYPVNGARLDLGRGDDVGIRIRDRAVSRRHARMRRMGSGYTIEDLHTSNGVFVNGVPAEGAVALEDGAVIELGQTLLRYQAGIEPEPEAAPEPELALEASAPQGEEASLQDRTGDAAPGAPGASRTGEADDQRPHRRQVSLELALMGVGVTLAVVGALLTFGLISG